MTLETTIIILILILILIPVVFTIISITINLFNQRDIETISFKEAMDLVELPVITFYNKDKKLNFLLDTGSNYSYINSSLISSIEGKELDDTINIVGVGGSQQSSKCYEIAVTYKNQTFVDTFYVGDLTSAFDTIKEESGVQIHGILGNRFFTKYKYLLDFDTLVAYSKKK